MSEPNDSGGKTPEEMRVEIGRIVALHFIEKNGYELYQNPIGTQGYRRCDLSGLWILRNKEGNFWGINHQRGESVIPEICKEFAERYDFPASLDAMAAAEATLTDEEKLAYAKALRGELAKSCTATMEEHFYPVITATALQRARAFLAVKEGASK